MNEDASICFEGWGTDEHLGDFIIGYPMNMDQMNSFVNAMVKNTNAWVIAVSYTHLTFTDESSTVTTVLEDFLILEHRISSFVTRNVCFRKQLML